MKIYSKILISLLCLLMLSGCVLFRNPIGSFSKAETKAQKVELKIQTNELQTISKARDYVFSADRLLLLNPETNRYTSLAQDFTSKAMLTLGPPTMEENLYLRQMVDNLLSTNKAVVLKGQKQVAKLDQQVIELQDENSYLQSKLSNAQDKIESVGKTNSDLAQKWAVVMKIIWGTIYVVSGIFVLRIISAVLPPPYNSIGSILDLLFGLITKGIQSLFPGSKTVAGVVSSDYKATTEQLIAAIQTIKDNHPELHSEVSQTVVNSVDSNLVKTVNAAKTNLGVTS